MILKVEGGCGNGRKWWSVWVWEGKERGRGRERVDDWAGVGKR